MRKEIRRALMAWSDAHKTEAGCIDCGYDVYPRALSFDHMVPGDKGKFLGRPGWHDAVRLVYTRTKAERLKEHVIETCEVRCLNCQAIRTATESHHLVNHGGGDMTTLTGSQERRLREAPIRQGLMIWSDAYKLAAGCVDCGFDAHPRALSFDHIMPGDRAKFLGYSGWSSAVGQVRSTIKAERLREHVKQTCEIRCLNCQIERTFAEGHHLVNREAR